ncbi:MAG: threonylcarbamoyl-AMP synthase [Bacteroidales bacterium]|jgi:L-threonylcarbamoyladenylate synthase|nr:threonylcarbamoyl-AMP synthase [Bacteroidales bacterium]
MEEEIEKCVSLLQAGKVILYPTDTIWGIGCDATNSEAIARIFNIKQREESRSMLVLIDKTDRLPLYVNKLPLIAWDLLATTTRPTTFIYPEGKNLPVGVIHPDGSVGIRVVQNSFCKKIISALGKPLISTSANLSGAPSPNTFREISTKILDAVDYIVPEKYAVSTDFKPSRIIRYIDDYNFAVIRE